MSRPDGIGLFRVRSFKKVTAVVVIRAFCRTLHGGLRIQRRRQIMGTGMHAHASLQSPRLIAAEEITKSIMVGVVGVVGVYPRTRILFLRWA